MYRVRLEIVVDDVSWVPIAVQSLLIKVAEAQACPASFEMTNPENGCYACVDIEDTDRDPVVLKEEIVQQRKHERRGGMIPDPPVDSLLN